MLRISGASRVSWVMITTLPYTDCLAMTWRAWCSSFPYLHPFIEEVEDEDEWMNSSVNPPSDLEDFNEITI